MNAGNFAKILGTNGNPEQYLFAKLLPCFLKKIILIPHTVPFPAYCCQFSLQPPLVDSKSKTPLLNVFDFYAMPTMHKATADVVSLYCLVAYHLQRQKWLLKGLGFRKYVALQFHCQGYVFLLTLDQGYLLSRKWLYCYLVHVLQK